MLLALRDEVDAAVASAAAAVDVPGEALGVEQLPADDRAVLAVDVGAGAVDDESPEAVAEALADAVDAGEYDYLGDAVARDSTVAFVPVHDYYAATLEAAHGPEYGSPDLPTESIVVEHTGATPTGPLDVERARNAVLGDVLCRILEFAGHNVERHYYVTDAGREMALFVWAYETLDEAELPETDREEADHDLARYYRTGREILDGDNDRAATAEAEIDELLAGLEDGEEMAYQRVASVVDQMLDGIRASLHRLDVTFDDFARESRFVWDGSSRDVADRLGDADGAREEDGAVLLDLDGADESLVVEQADGCTSRAANDIAHHEWTFDEFDAAVTVLPADEADHERKLAAALDVLGHDDDRVPETVVHDPVTLAVGDSATDGSEVDLDDLLEATVGHAREVVEARLGDDADDVRPGAIARTVGIGALRHEFVFEPPSEPLAVEHERALSFEPPSGPHLLAAHARARDLVDAADWTPSPVDAALLKAPEERRLLDAIASFPAAVEQAATEREPNRVAESAREIAAAYDAFDDAHDVLDADDDRRDTRLAMVDATRQTLARALDLLGIEVPETI